MNDDELLVQILVPWRPHEIGNLFQRKGGSGIEEVTVVRTQPTKVFIVRALIFAVVYAVVESLYRFAGLGTISVAFWVSAFVAGVLFALVLGYIFSRVAFRLSVRIAMAWLALFIIEQFSNLVEGYFFTTQIPTTTLFLAATTVSLAVTFVQALLVGILFTPKEPLNSIVAEARDYFGQRPWYSWLWRIVLCSAVYFPIYFTFGGIVSPIVLPYYTESSSGLGLRVPSFEVMVPLELLRGFLYVIALLPLLVALRIRRRALYAATVSLLYVTGALGPFLIDETLPVLLRTVHGIEILADYVVFGAVIVHLLGRRS